MSTVSLRHFLLLCAAVFLLSASTALSQVDSPAALRESGKALLKTGKRTEAIVVFTRVTELDPRLGEAFVDRGNAYLELTQWDEAFADYSRAIAIEEKKPPSADRDRVLWRAYTNCGTYRNHRREWVRALADFDHAVALNPEGAPTYYGRALANSGTGQKEKSDADFLTFVHLKGYTEASEIDLAQKAYDAGNFPNAVNCLYVALLLNPRSERALVLRGEMSLISDPRLAAEDYQKAIAINPANALALSGMGVIETNKGNAAQAKKYLEAARKADPRLPILYLRLGNFALAFKHGDERVKDALANYTKAIELEPKLAFGYFGRGNVYLELKKHDQALVEFAKVIELEPKHFTALNNRGVLYKRLGKYDLALADLTRATEVAPGYADAYFNRGTVYSVMEDLPRALADFNRARDISPADAQIKDSLYTAVKSLGADPDAMSQRGTEFSKSKDYPRAIEQYTRVLDCDCVLRDVRYNRAIAYQLSGQTANARADWERLVRYYPDDVTVRQQLAYLLLFAVGDGPAAAEHYQKLTELEPKNALAHCRLADAMVMREQYAPAVSVYAKALALDPGLSEIYVGRSQAYLRTEEWERALVDLNRVLKLQPNNAQVILRRSIVYYVMGDFALAIAEVRRARTLEPTLTDPGYSRYTAEDNKEAWAARTHPVLNE